MLLHILVKWFQKFSEHDKGFLKGLGVYYPKPYMRRYMYLHSVFCWVPVLTSQALVVRRMDYFHQFVHVIPLLSRKFNLLGVFLPKITIQHGFHHRWPQTANAFVGIQEFSFYRKNSISLAPALREVRTSWCFPFMQRQVLKQARCTLLHAAIYIWW